MDRLQSLWHNLTAPRAVDEDEARQEYMTKVILVMMGMVLFICTLLIIVGWGNRMFWLHDMVIMLLLDLTLCGGWWLAHRGRWRWSGYIPPAMFFSLALYITYRNGLITAALLFYAITILLVGMLQGTRAQWYALPLNIGAYLVMGWVHGDRSLELLAVSVITVGSSFTGIVLLQWLFSSLYQRTLTQARVYATELVVVNERLEQQITEREQVEETLRESEKRYRELVETVNDLVFTIDVKGDLLFVNSLVKRFTGYELKEVRGHNVTEYVHPDDVIDLLRNLQQALSGESPENVKGGDQDAEYRMVRKDGGVVWVAVRAQPIVDTEGRIVSFSGIARDITERKRAEEALRESEEKFSKAFQSSPMGVLITRLADGQFIEVNEAVEKLLGYRRKELVGRTSLELGLVSPEDRERSKQILQEQGLLRNLEAKFYTKSSDERVGLFSGEIIEIGGETCLIQVVSDITERVRAEEERQRLYEQAQQDAEIKAMLLREVNHRVKNNLTAIIGLLYTEQRYADTADQATTQAITQNLVNRINGLATVHKLLSASEWAPLSLSNLAIQVLRSSLQLAPCGKGASVEVGSSSVRVMPDQAHNLALVINELATNTVKHALQERGKAHIAIYITEDGDDMVQFEYRDDGPGYPEDVLVLERHGVGFDLIQSIVRQGLRGELSLHNDRGAVAVIRFKAQA